jgi:tritrans,polycis-undecaprenyl-diphosphate synthase [geranylgeranyl-diphosphate specific]
MLVRLVAGARQIDEKIIENTSTQSTSQQEPTIMNRNESPKQLPTLATAYSELFIVDVYWPDFREIDLQRVIRNYQQRSRRYGK